MIETHPKIAQNPVQWTPAMRDSAARESRVYQEGLRKGRRLPPVLKEVSKISEMQQVHVFNVGPWDENVAMGSWGSVMVQACPKGQKYIHVHTFPGIYNEPQPEDGKFSIDQVSGAYMAQCLLGEGPDLRNVPISESRRKYGVFIGSVVGPDGVTPLDSEIQAAMAALEEYMHELLLEANKAFSAGGKEAEAVIGSKHRLAAMIQGRTDLPWIKEQTPERRVACGFCGTMISSAVVKCPQCREIVDQAKYAAMTARAAVQPPLSPTQGKRA